ncbi:MAG TPA: WYL domain-containing transcriptional regulator [Gammaproteobacteria bacterium]|nr:WYL domain-containing transcriptional regulator [Gammaproteobacteria bacterium]
MDRGERIYKLHRVFHSRRTPIRVADLCTRLNWSRSTVYRVLSELRDILGAPIIKDPATEGYCYDPEAEDFELPGLWFNSSELHALFVMSELLRQVQPGFLEPELEPWRDRITELLHMKHAAGPELVRRVRILGMAARSAGKWFQTCAEALLRRRQLAIRYHSRSKDTHTDRTVSPQRLVHYRDNWYLDAWCHAARALRTFSVDRILAAKVLDEEAREIPDAELDRHFATAYGIFAGEPSAVAVLCFTPRRARWVAEEQWHPQQQGRFLDDGSYELRVPYGDPTELIMDILKYGPDVEVRAPEALREAVKEKLESALARYASRGKVPWGGESVPGTTPQKWMPEETARLTQDADS